MASSQGSAKAAPAPRKKVRRGKNFRLKGMGIELQQGRIQALLLRISLACHHSRMAFQIVERRSGNPPVRIRK
jgi:hypothetical protein